MRIVRIIARLNVGGPARHVTLLNAGLQHRGHRTLLVHGLVDEGEASLEHLTGEMGIEAVLNPNLGRRVRPTSDLRALLAILAVLFRESPDVVHTHTAKAGALGRLAALLFNATRRRRRRCLIVHTYHGHVLEGYYPTFVNRMIRMTERMLGAMTDRIVAISPSQRRDLAERFRIAPAEKITTVLLGLDLTGLLTVSSASPTFRELLNVTSGDVIIGYCGRLVPIKDIPTLLAAFARALQRNRRLRLVIAGGGPLSAALEALAKELRVSDHVHFLGWVEDLRTLYATFDICALSSLNEGTPVAAIEAMAAGKPVVATAVGGIPDVVENGTTGLLVPVGSAEALSDAILQLASDPAGRARMGECARLRVQRYSTTRLVSNIEELYTAALAQKRSDASHYSG